MIATQQEIIDDMLDGLSGKERQQVELDVIAYGNAFVRTKPDGTKEVIDPGELYIIGQGDDTIGYVSPEDRTKLQRAVSYNQSAIVKSMKTRNPT